MKRRILAMLLVACMVLSCFPAGVSAAQQKEYKGTHKEAWSFQAMEAPADSLLNKKSNAALQELKIAAEEFAADELVSAFVVMEEAPLAETHTSKAHVSAGLSQQKLQKQNNVIAAIENTVLGGAKLNVRYQFTYLTNSFSIETEFANLEKIAVLDGVKSVFIMPVYNAITTNETASPNTAGSAVMTGVDMVWDELGYTGKGMKIAVIDTGLDLDHPAFAAAPAEASMTSGDVAEVLRDLNAYALSNPAASSLYRSAKVPFAYNYADRNLIADHSRDDQSDHGTHVSGIAAANAVSGANAKGMAPDAQVIVMKVFGATRAGYTDDIVAALEDAMTLGCDVVNLSLGSPAGFTTTDSEVDLIYERLADQEIVACISAGNEDHTGDYNMWDTYLGIPLNRTANPDNATVGEPGVYHNVLTVASADNAATMGDYFSVGGNKVFYMDNIEYLYGEVSCSLRDFAGDALDYVVIDGLGAEEDFYSGGRSLVNGKVAVVLRGELSFAEKVMNAEDAGAIACIIWNHNDEDDLFSFGMTTSDESIGYMPGIPAAIISLSDGTMMEEAANKTMVVAEEMAMRVDPNGGQISSFSSWGVAPDLTLEPDITGVGGNVYSTIDNGQYGLMSGTSMSSPQVAGVTALVMERLYEEFPNEPAGTLRNMAEAILMSTANPIWGSEAETSPRQQGAGLVDAYQAMTSKTYLTVNGGKPKASLGDSTTGNYSFTFEVHNEGDVAVTYTLAYSLNTEAAASAQLSATEVEYFMYGEEMPLESEVTFNANTVTVPAGSTARVTATIALNAADKAYFEEAWENGGYVNGYVYLLDMNDEGEIIDQLNMPFLGFYGDWTEAPVFDSAFWYDNTFFEFDPVNGIPEGDMFWHVLWTTAGAEDWVPGMNPYADPMLDTEGKLVYDPAFNVVSPNNDGYVDGIDDIYLSLLRNAKTLTLTWTVDGNTVYTETSVNNPKTMFIPNYGQVVPWIHSWYGYYIYDFTDENGDVLPSGTEVLLTVDAEVDYGDGGNHSLYIPLLVDVDAPVLVSVTPDSYEGSDYLFVEISDDSPAAVFLLDPDTEEPLTGTAAFQETQDGNYVAAFDITGMGTEFIVAAGDYGVNESYYLVDAEGDFEEDPSEPSQPSQPSEPETGCPVYVGGVGMNDGDYLAVGATATTTTQPSGGYAYYEDGVLTLNDYSYSGKGYVYDIDYDFAAAIYAEEELEIVVEGENSLVQPDDMSDCVFLSCGGTISGTGEMTTTGGFYSIWSDGSNEDISFNGSTWSAAECAVAYQVNGNAVFYINGGSISAVAYRYGITTDNGCCVVTGGNMSVKATEISNEYNYCAILGVLDVAEDLEIRASVDADGPLGTYVEANQGTYHWIEITDPNPEEPTEPSEPTDPEEPSDPSDPTDPEEPSDPTDPTDPEEPSDPSDPTDPEEPSDPTDPEEPSDPSEPTDPEEPSDPTEPEDPTEPSEPDEPYEPAPGVIRLSGANRYATGFAIADQLKEMRGIDKFDTVIVAYGQNFPDALTGSYLASVTGAPILLTEKNMDLNVGAYIYQNLEPGGKVYILGGTAAVTDEFEAGLMLCGFDVVRLKGAGRYETNLAILREAGVNRTDEILIATGTNYADSLSASATGLPMLLVGDKLTDAQKMFLGTTSKRFVILGGTGAVSAEVEAELDEIGTVTRVKGASRYGTSVAIAERYFTNPDAAVLAYAEGFPDGLCGGPLALAMGAPLILTSNDSFWDADDYVEGIESGVVTGGTGRISDAIVREIFDLAPGTPIERP